MCSEQAYIPESAEARRERYAGNAARALSRLGPARVARALAALSHVGHTSWDDCFLALAYGPPGALRAVITGRNPIAARTAVAIAAEVLGLYAHEALAVVELYDDQVPEGRARLQSLCAEYMETNRVAVLPREAVAG